MSLYELKTLEQGVFSLWSFLFLIFWVPGPNLFCLQKSFFSFVSGAIKKIRHSQKHFFDYIPSPSVSLFVIFFVEFAEIFSISVLQNNSKHPLTKLIKKYSENNCQNVNETSKIHIANFFWVIFRNFW